MKKQQILRREAERDLTEAHAWYEEKVPGPGSDFLVVVERTLASIQEESFSIAPDLSRRTSRIAKPLPLWSVLCLGKAADFNSCSDAYCSGSHKMAPSLTNRPVTTRSSLDTRFARATECSRYVL
jgi:hypothetical protein